jgi:hypothetical protein
MALLTSHSKSFQGIQGWGLSSGHTRHQVIPDPSILTRLHLGTFVGVGGLAGEDAEVEHVEPPLGEHPAKVARAVRLHHQLTGRTSIVSCVTCQD